MEPASYDFRLAAGNTFPFEVRLPFNCAGDEWVLRIVDLRGIQIARRAVSQATLSIAEFSASPVKWRVFCQLTKAETRAMKAYGARYELERRVTGGEEQTYLCGRFEIISDVNDD